MRDVRRRSALRNRDRLRKSVLQFCSVGWIILIVYGIQASWTAVPRRRSWITTGVFLLFILGCSRTVLRNKDWTSRETLIKYVTIRTISSCRESCRQLAALDGQLPQSDQS
jgi:hypothetical protein